MAWQIKGKTSC